MSDVNEEMVVVSQDPCGSFSIFLLHIYIYIYISVGRVYLGKIDFFRLLVY